MGGSPLGKTAAQPRNYAPDVLFPIARADQRARIGLSGSLPFEGFDTWNAWELTWLGTNGRPRVATAEIRVPADSPNIVESKSLKLYLGSFAMSPFDDAVAVRDTIARDLGESVGSTVDVRVDPLAATDGRMTARLPGETLDDLDVACDSYEVEPRTLSADPDDPASEELCSDLLRSLCPVTGQPDSASVVVRYRGPRIDRAGLLQYLVSYREHQDFHECCVERMFVDILSRCVPERLSVYARYQRRGGIDINPFRSNFGDSPPNLRLWRQ